MAALTPQTIGVTGTLVTYAAATSGAGGDTLDGSLADGRTWYEVNNASGGSINAILDVPGTVYGQARPDVTVAVAAGALRRIGPITADLVDPTTNTSKLTYSAVTSVTVAAVRI